MLVHPATDLYRFLFKDLVYKQDDRYTYEEIMINDSRISYNDENERIRVLHTNPQKTSPFFVEKSKNTGIRLHQLPIRNLGEMFGVLNMLRNQVLLNDIFLDYIQKAQAYHGVSLDYCILRIFPVNSMQLEISINEKVFEMVIKISDGSSVSIKECNFDCAISDRDLKPSSSQTPSLFELLLTNIISRNKTIELSKIDS